MLRLNHMLRAVLAYAILPVALCFAQPAAKPAFEAAAIKPSTATDNSSSTRSNNGRITMQNLSIKQIIMSAYRLQEYQYSGPAWIEGERYNIDAKADTKVNDADMMAMLQTLLAERFKLEVHHESKSVSGYAMVVAKNGLKIQPVEGQGSSMNTNNTKLTATHINMERLARWVGGVLRQPVVDESGVKGDYTFELEFENPRPGRSEKNENEPVLPTIFTALTEKLGLKLETRKVPIDVIVVDHIERPTEN